MFWNARRIGKTVYIHHVLVDTYGYITCNDPDLLNAMYLKQEERLKAPKWPTDWDAARRFSASIRLLDLLAFHRARTR